jgi:aspartate ammonia-lyase
MNINEIICNRALRLVNHNPGEYQYIHPIEHANIFQSTNDVIPTSLKVTLLKLLQELTTSINALRHSLEEIEKNSQDHLRCAYTEMQEAVPSTYGRLFSTYNEAFSRDWWRTSKCSERIKTVNIGGSAIGSGITVPGLFIRDVVMVLQEITGLPVSRAENLHDATCNLDSLVEVHAILKAHAVNLEKMVSDIRLLSSDLMINREVTIPKIQTGSSIMPGKVNPVIPEFVISASHKIYANDQLISSLAGQGNLDLNAYIPVIGHAMIESVQLLIACDDTLNSNLVKGIQINRVNSLENFLKYPSIVTALVPYIGYIKAAELADAMKRNNINVFEANKIKGIMDEDKIKRIISPANLLKEGFSLNDITE